MLHAILVSLALLNGHRLSHPSPSNSECSAKYCTLY